MLSDWRAGHVQAIQLIFGCGRGRGRRAANMLPLAAHLTRIERELNEKNEDILDEDDPFRESPAAVAERARQFTTIKELLTAATLGTS